MLIEENDLVGFLQQGLQLGETICNKRDQVDRDKERERLTQSEEFPSNNRGLLCSGDEDCYIPYQGSLVLGNDVRLYETER